MNFQPRISIITITRDNARGLERTLASVVGQSMQPYEHIIVDGMSTDSTDMVLSRDIASHAIICHCEPRGVYDAINKGIEKATGDIIGLLHAGDTFTSTDILEKITHTFITEPSLDFTFGDIHFARPDNTRVIRYYSAKDYRPEDIAEGFSPPHPSLYIKADVQRRIGLYKTHYKVSADFEMFARLFSDNTLRWKYMPMDMVTMTPGGLSSRLIHRLYTHNHERLMAFSENNIKSSYWHILKHYLKVLKSYTTHPDTP